MRHGAGLNAAKAQVTSALGRDVLLIERFDRANTGARRATYSALTILELEQTAGRHATYHALADQTRSRIGGTP